MIYPNVEETKKLIQQLVRIPSPTGFTTEAIEFVEEQLKEIGIDTKRNRKGGLIATIKGKDETRHRFLTAHVDTLGAMVRDKGRRSFKDSSDRWFSF